MGKSVESAALGSSQNMSQGTRRFQDTPLHYCIGQDDFRYPIRLTGATSWTVSSGQRQRDSGECRPPTVSGTPKRREKVRPVDYFQQSPTITITFILNHATN